jgi:guanine nucleotide-binding protein alpha-1 subunit
VHRTPPDKSAALGGGVGNDWRIFDVGGHRSLRAAWVPYFDNMDAIIFLAPISAFDQVLAEAPKVNRLEDSVLIWSQIVSNQLLKDTELILFLNKCDILRGKLESGIRFREYVVSYGSRPNDFESASSCECFFCAFPTICFITGLFPRSIRHPSLFSLTPFPPL